MHEIVYILSDQLSSFLYFWFFLKIKSFSHQTKIICSYPILSYWI